MVDYIVVGGGSAGSALAGRLAMADAGKVLVIEAGPRDVNPLIHIPAGFVKLLDSDLLYHYRTVQQAALNGRAPVMPQGAVLGGGGSVNAAIYVRGQRRDYDDWARLGADGWSYSDVLPYFRRAEDNDRLSDAYHGTGGPLGVSDLRQVNDLTRAFVRSAQEAGIPFTPDFNGVRQRGVGFNQTTTRNGRRCSAAVGYLRPAMKSGNLEIRTGCLVTRILFEGDRATGVEYVRNGKLETIHADKEIILSGGAVQTPKLLMLSGIGPEAELRQHGITVRHRLEGVGQNLQDHLEFPAIRFCTGRYGYYGEDSFLRSIRNGLQYLLFKSGPVMSNVTEACAFVNVDDMEAEPNVQMHFVPIVFMDSDQQPIKRAGATVNPCVLRPESRGEIRLKSTRPTDHPIVDPRYLTAPEDMRLSLRALKLAREILAQPSFAGYVEKTEAYPGEVVADEAALETYIRSKGKTVYHPVGTCRMGNDEMAVVDPQLRVHGFRNLRIVDNSVMPTLISGNTNATAIMIGEKASDMIRGLTPLAPSNA
ncbi:MULTISPECIES: GMC family oxidoreductase [Agrobacterium]|uniref:GMC family oxidoreductase n=1 Tax=Agrobacterium TaxID=357 RepID=UPI0022FFC6FB|nr:MULTISPECIES: GMC family oxidoreductase N-terminal domain-containing protein [Agrobacterium]MDA5639566.1 GMC family oxidoreductase N-terminal domain-containing protein [Agrobacterium sp. ST15.13.013]MDA6999539.1 GMC family oxidoreductase N-terminal domain-containing protein [Agrobacterium salinitolerans]